MALENFQLETRYRNINSLKAIEKSIMNKKMMGQLSDIIANIKIPGPYERTTHLFKKLVQKFKSQIQYVEKDPEICDITAKKLARFVEDATREACLLEKSKSYLASRHDQSMPEPVMSEISKLQTQTKRPVYMKKIPRSIADKIPRTGPIYTATIGGQRVYIEDVLKNDGKALITMPQSVGKLGGEWSSWLIDVQADTNNWVRWLDHKALAIDSSSFEEVPSCSTPEDISLPSQIDYLDELKRRRLFFDTPSTEKIWNTSSLEQLISSRSASSIDLNSPRTRLRAPLMKPRVAEKRYLTRDESPRPKTSYDLSPGAKNSPYQQQLKARKNLDFRVLYSPGTMRKDGGIILRD